MQEPKFISHIRKDIEGNIEAIQSNEDHCLGVAELARQFASEFGMGDFGYIMGLLHDKGKEKDEFQNYIRFENELADKKAYTQEGKAHAYAGGLMAKKYMPMIAPLIENPIMGHHRGLYDFPGLEKEEEKSIPAELLSIELQNPAIPPWFSSSILQEKDFHHIERILYSCLVDADYLDSERFMQPRQASMREGKATLAELLPLMNTYLACFGEPQTEVNRIRNDVQKVCQGRAHDTPGFYSLTVPTGGGKTLSSLVWAINHAVHHGKRRIIIAIPYTSIIVQTAGILRNIFGEENVLEHHSNLVVDDKDDQDLRTPGRLATENWDYPIIVTTNVQLFESMMASKPSECRKLHNISNSVLILDEVQTLPTDFLQPIVDTLDTYQRLFGVSVLFTTASQPVLEGNHQGTNPSVLLKGLKKIREIIPAGWNLHDKLRRVSLSIDNSPQTYDSIATQLAKHDRVLCIVNTRRDAKEIFDRLPDDGIRIHLSRMMCPAHVSRKIEEMKRVLGNPCNKVVRVVSTQLIEAGVDIDFPVVYRQEAGLDSILQAAGRCNREGLYDLCTTYVFSLAGEHTLPKGLISQGNNARLNMDSQSDWFSPETMSNFYLQLYSRIQSFDKKDIKHYLYKYGELMFETAAQEFRLIDDETQAVIVNWKGSLSLVDRLKSEDPTYRLIRQLCQYSVNLRKRDFDEMLDKGIIEEVVEGFYVATGESQYNDNLGLLTDNQWLEETYII